MSAQPSHVVRFAAVLYMLLGTAGSAFVIITDWPGAYLGMSWIAGAMFTCLIVFEWRRNGDPVSPAGIVGIGGLLIFFLRPLTIDAFGTTTAGAAAQTQDFEGDFVYAGRRAIVQVIVFFVMFGAVYFWRASRVDSRPSSERGLSVSVSVDTLERIRVAGLCLKAAFVAAILALAYLIESAGGVGTYLSGVAFRTTFFAGRFYLTLGYLPLAVTLVHYVLLRRRAGIKAWTSFGVASALLLVLSAFFTGGRGPLILGALMPLLALKQLGPKPWRPAGLSLTGAVLLLGALLMSLLLRTNVYDKGQSARDLHSSPASTLLNTLTSGSETRPFDSLVLLDEEARVGSMHLQYGATYLKAPTYFVPGSLLPGKDNGANTYFTKNYLPAFYYPDRVETSISVIGEAYINFDWLGIIAMGAVFGLAASLFTRPRSEMGHLGCVLYVLITPLFFSYMRGDAYGNFALVLITAGLAWAVYAALPVAAPGVEPAVARQRQSAYRTRA